MGQKVNPTGFRTGISKKWLASWFAEGEEYRRCLHEDLLLRREIKKEYKHAGIDRIVIERDPGRVKVVIFSSKPGIIIGSGGQNIEKLRKYLQTQVKSEVLLNIQSVNKPDLSASLVAQSIARQLEDRKRFRRVLKQTVSRVMKNGAKGVKVRVKGRLDGAEMARMEWNLEGQVPLHTLRADIDYGFDEARTTYGNIGVTVWIYRGNFPDF
ncbi:30S ribosomal protein S3 [bacterium]|jgi:small subunit ribosomal protein S3|nr:30S ribosomal protein S3 [bacterium]